MIEVKAPFQYFTTAAGAPLDWGKIYIGQPGQNPETNPITVHWVDDDGTKIPAAQPIITNGGYPARNGKASKIYTEQSYSIMIRDRNGLIVSSASGLEATQSVSDIVQLISVNSADDGKTVDVVSYHPGWQTAATGPIGGDVFTFNASMPKSSHNGGTIISPTVPWDGTVSNLNSFLGGVGETDPSGNGCWVRKGRGLEGTTPQFGAKVDGTTNDYVATQKSVNVLKIVHVPDTGYKTIINSQLVLPQDTKLCFNTDCSVSADPLSLGTPLIKSTSSYVLVSFKSGKGFDFDGHPNWIGFYASNPNDMIEEVHARGGYHKNVGVDATGCIVWGMSGVRDGSMKGGKFYNCGVVSNVSGGGYVIYHDNCENMKVMHNRGRKVGSTFINSSCGLNNTHTGNRAKDVTLFPYKGGYGIGPVVSSHLTPTATTFSVAKNGTALRTIKVGQYLVMPTVAYPCPKGYIKAIADNGTHLTITLASDSPATPTVGLQIQPIDTGSIWHGNSSNYCGDNAFDMNGVANFTCYSNDLDFSGWYQGAGVYAGLRSGIWVGYDPQGGINSMDGDGVHIFNNNIRNTYGSAILTVASDRITIDSNQLLEYNQGQDPGNVNPTHGGIDVCRTGFHRATDVKITNNRFNSKNGYAIYAGYSTRMLIADNAGRSLVGIKCNTPRQLNLNNNDVQVFGNGGYMYLISDDSGVNPGSGVRVHKNSGYHEGATGYCFRNTDTGLTALDVSDDNTWECANTAVVRYQDLSTSNSTPAYSGLFGNVGSKTVRFALAAGDTIDLANYHAENGFMGGVIIEGFARSGTSATEAFRMVFHGHIFSSTGVFTSLGSTGSGAFLALADFMSQVNTPNAGDINCRYKNNEANTVYMVLSIRSFSGM